MLERIRELETELADQWKRLGDVPGEETEIGIHALEITVANRPYLIPADSVREVVRMVRPQHLAESPDWVLGVVAYGSKTIPVVDLGLRLENRPTDVQPDLFLVITDNPRWLGLVTDGVGSVVEVEVSSLATPGPELRCAPYILGVKRGDEGEGISLLSVGRLGRELDG
jgi:chemotaxis signal transduction protein